MQLTSFGARVDQRRLTQLADDAFFVIVNSFSERGMIFKALGMLKTTDMFISKYGGKKKTYHFCKPVLKSRKLHLISKNLMLIELSFEKRLTKILR